MHSPGNMDTNLPWTREQYANLGCLDGLSGMEESRAMKALDIQCSSPLFCFCFPTFDFLLTSILFLSLRHHEILLHVIVLVSVYFCPFHLLKYAVIFDQAMKCSCIEGSSGLIKMQLVLPYAAIGRRE